MCIRDRSRDYEEFMERLEAEMIYNKYLPCNETEGVGDNENNDFTNYIIMTNSVSYTHLDVYKRQYNFMQK